MQDSYYTMDLPKKEEESFVPAQKAQKDIKRMMNQSQIEPKPVSLSQIFMITYNIL
jgi:hypothetical protein